MPILIKWDARDKRQAVKALQKLFGGTVSRKGKVYGPYGGILDREAKIAPALVQVHGEATARQVELILSDLGMNFRRCS